MTVTPADRANTISTFLAGRIAKASIILLTLLAGHRSASCAAVGLLGAGNANISHATGTIRRADTASEVVEVLAALRVPKKTPLLAVIALVYRPCPSSVRGWLVAEGAVVTELFGAVLPADRPNTIVAVTALRVT